MKKKNKVLILNIFILGFIVVANADAVSKNESLMACSAITADAMSKLDPNVRYIAGNEFSNKTISDCEWLIDEAKGDPQRASEGYNKVVSNYSDYMTQMAASPLTDQQTRYVLVNLFQMYQYAMGSAAHAAGDYGYLREQASITKKGMSTHLP